MIDFLEDFDQLNPPKAVMAAPIAHPSLKVKKFTLSPIITKFVNPHDENDLAVFTQAFSELYLCKKASYLRRLISQRQSRFPRPKKDEDGGGENYEAQCHAKLLIGY